MVLRCSDGEVENETKAIDDLLKLGVKGMIIMCSQDENYNPKILQMVVDNFPVVTVDRQMKGIPVPHIGTDNTSAARELTKFLLDKGYRKICFAKPDAYETSTLQERQKGFIAAMNECGMVTDDSSWIADLRATLPSKHFDELIEEDMEKILRHIERYSDIEAFLAAEYGIALILYECLRKKGLEKKYPIVCFDCVENMINDYSFTYIKQGEDKIGTLAVETLIEVINGSKNSKHIMVPYEIKKTALD
jgi:DNA-binding LacI/PurR family transcriptional regulator